MQFSRKRSKSPLHQIEIEDDQPPDDYMDIAQRIVAGHYQRAARIAKAVNILPAAVLFIALKEGMHQVEQAAAIRVQGGTSAVARQVEIVPQEE